MASQIRKATPDDAQGIAKVHVDSWRETYPGLMPEEILNGLSYRQRELYWRRTLRETGEEEFAYLVEDDAGEVMGFVSGGPEREGGLAFKGEIYAIYLLKEHQRQGWGKRLFRAATDHLVRSGMKSMLLWVHRDNETRGFYEAMGGTLVDEKSIDFGESELILVAYGWLDLSQLTHWSEEP